MVLFQQYENLPLTNIAQNVIFVCCLGLLGLGTIKVNSLPPELINEVPFNYLAMTMVTFWPGFIISIIVAINYRHHQLRLFVASDLSTFWENVRNIVKSSETPRRTFN